jgi:argininosuccinate lyase
MTGLIGGLRVDAQRMTAAAGDGYTTATAVADTLVELGVPFRSAHGIVGGLVAAAESADITLDALPDEAIADALRASDDALAVRLAEDVAVAERLRQAATVEGALARFDVIGGTAPGRVAAELDRAEARLAEA